MNNVTTQKTIKVGSSLAVTIPAKEAKRQGIVAGDAVKVTFERLEPRQDDVLQDYAAFKAQYGETLKNLADR
jgi:antitoxin component of MazEF toxin-antitoxin module